MLYNLILHKSSLQRTLPALDSDPNLNSDTTNVVDIILQALQPLLSVQLNNININDTLDFKDNFSCKLVHLVAANGSHKLFKALLDVGAGVNVKDSHGNTLLHCAAMGGSIEILNILLAKNIYLHDKNINGYTSLHLAVVSGNEKIVQALLVKGARINAKNQDGQTPLQLAIFGNPIIQRIYADQIHADGRLLNEKEAAELIRAKPNIPIVLPKMVEHLIKSAIVRNMRQPNLVTSHPELYKFWGECIKESKLGRETSEEMMIDVVGGENVGMDIDQHYLVDTNITNAAANGHVNVVKHLIEQGADAHVKDQNGKTALHFTFGCC